METKLNNKIDQSYFKIYLLSLAPWQLYIYIVYRLTITLRNNNSKNIK